MYILYSKVFKALIRAKKKQTKKQRHKNKPNSRSYNILFLEKTDAHHVLKFPEKQKMGFIHSWDQVATRSRSVCGAPSTVVIIAAAWKLIKEFVNDEFLEKTKLIFDFFGKCHLADV